MNLHFHLKLDDNGTEGGLELIAIIDVRPAPDDRHRDATAVHQQVALAALLFADP